MTIHQTDTQVHTPKTSGTHQGTEPTPHTKTTISPKPSPRFRQVFQPLLLPLSGVLIALALWQLISSSGLVSASLPDARATLLALAGFLPQTFFWAGVAQTLGTALAGFLVSGLLGIPLGMLIGLNRYAGRASKAVVEFVKPVPPIVVLPLAVLLFGSTREMSLVLIFWALIPMFVVTTAAGVRDADPLLLETASSYRLGRVRTIMAVVWPGATPFVATGLRVGASLAVIITVVSEIVGGASGVGRQLDVYRQAGLAAEVFAQVIVLGLLGVSINYTLVAVERKVLYWHESVRGHQRPGDTQGSALPSWLVRATRPIGNKLRAAAIGDRFDLVADTVNRRHAMRSGPPAPRKTAPASTFRPQRRTRVTGVLPNVVFIAVPAMLLLWWWVASKDSVNPFFPPLQTILRRFREIWISDTFVSDALPSLTNLGLGLGTSIVAGILVGAAMARLHWLGQMLDPLVAFMRSIPGVAYIPILITLVGFTTEMRVLAIVLTAMFPVLIATADGMRSVDATLQEVGSSYRIGRLRKLGSIYLPAAAPRIFAGIEVSLGMSLVVMIASELMGTSTGIGAQVALAQNTLAFADMWAGILLLALLGLLSNGLFNIVRKYVLSWYYGARATARAS